MGVLFKRLFKKRFGRNKFNKKGDIGKYEVDSALEVLQDSLNKLTESTNTLSASADAETYKGSEGDIKINKVGKNEYDFYIRGEDGWHKDNNSSFGPVGTDSARTGNQMSQSAGSWNYSYEGLERLIIDLDNSKRKTGQVATPTIKGIGNLKIESTGNTILQSALQMTTVENADSDPDKFLVLDGSNNVKYRTGAQVLSDTEAIKRKVVFSSDFAGRYSLGTSDNYITGYPGYWVKSTSSGIHTGQDTADVTLGVDYVKYCLMMPESGTVTGFVCDCEWDNANGEVDVDLWKVDAIADTGSALTSVALDHIARITFTDPGDTTYYKSLADNGGLDSTAKVFTAGESLLVTGMSEDSTDGSSVYLRPVVTVVYDS